MNCCGCDVADVVKIFSNFASALYKKRLNTSILNFLGYIRMGSFKCLHEARRLAEKIR